MFGDLRHMAERRRRLREHIDFQPNFELWEESCVPSYCHQNRLAAWVSWRRLFVAARLAKSLNPRPSRVLDFGSSVGELGHLLTKGTRYDFIESHDPAANFLTKELPNSRRTTFDEAPDGGYDQIFAIDSLEHNDNYSDLLDHLSRKLRPNGLLILSGPTENWLYRLGRKIAGFEGHYHETNIHAIERAAAKILDREHLINLFPGLTLFRITAWRLKR